MKIIISPTKKMVIDNDSFKHKSLPFFIEESKTIKEKLLTFNKKELKSLWKCSDKLLEENYERLINMDLYSNLTCAIMSYRGLQFQYMAPSLFTKEQLEYVDKHLIILSGFYGALKPFDGVTPYRLEMQSRLSINDNKDLYEFWSEKITKKLEADLIINLASNEYSKVINLNKINIIFGELINDKVVEKGTLCKMARGEMVRYMAENNIKDVDSIKNFDRLGYKYNKEFSDEYNIVFIKD